MFLHILRRLHKTYSIQEQTSPGEDNHELIIIYFRNHRVKCYSCELVSAPDISLHPYNLLEQMLAESTEAAVYSNIQHYTALWMLANRKHSSTSANTYLPSPPRYFLTYPLCNFSTRSSNQHYWVKQVLTHNLTQLTTRRTKKELLRQQRRLVHPYQSKPAMSRNVTVPDVQIGAVILTKRGRIDHMIQSVRCAIIHGILIQYTYIVERNRRRRNWSRIFHHEGADQPR